MNVNNEILSQNIKIKKIPRFIKNKILFLKIFAVFQMLIALSLITILTFTLLIYYQNDHNNYYQSVMKSVMSKLAINDAINSIFNKIIDYFKIDLIPYPILLFFLLVVAVLIFFYGFFNLKLIWKQKRIYQLWLKNNQDMIPDFVYAFYKRSIVYKIVANWFCPFFYLLSIISLLLLVWLQHNYDNGNKTLHLGFWKIAELRSLKSEIVIISTFFLLLFVYHCFIFLHAKRIRTQILSYWGKDLLTDEQKAILRKRTNKICFIIIAIILTLAIFSVYLIFRSIKRKSTPQMAIK